MNIDPWFLEHLVCPIDKTPLQVQGENLVSRSGRAYPVVEGVPVMLPGDKDATIRLAKPSLQRANQETDSIDQRCPNLYLESLGIGETEKGRVLELFKNGRHEIDPVVSGLVGATNGIAYQHLIGKLKQYPIPEIRLPDGSGKTMLDVGCSWGRWSVAAARKGYQTVGIDPSLGAVMAARRVAKQLGLNNRYMVGDARYLPFPDGTFDQYYSYSVLQHFSKPNAILAFEEAGRTLKTGGNCLIQMPNWLGIRCLQHQIRRGFREPVNFEVRYWTTRQLKAEFTKAIGPTQMEVDCFFGLGLQKSDMHLMHPLVRVLVQISEALRKTSVILPPLTEIADSVFLRSSKTGSRGQ